MSVTVTHQGRRAKIALGSAHVAVREVVARAKAHFGLEGSFGLRTTRGRRADVPDAAAWAHTGLSNNCELELVRRAGGGGGAVRVAAAVRTWARRRGPCRSRSTRARRWPQSSSAWWPRAPRRRTRCAARRRSGSCGIDSRARTSGGRSGISATAAARPCASTWNCSARRRRGAAREAAARRGGTRRCGGGGGQSLRRPQSRHNPQRRSRPLRRRPRRRRRALAAAPRPASRRRCWGGGRGFGGPRRAVVLLKYVEAVLRQPSLPRVRARSAPGTRRLRAASRPPAASRCSPLSDSTRNGAAASPGSCCATPARATPLV